MNWNPPVEQQIREAVESGAWHDPSLHGRKLDLSDYFAMPEDLRLGYSILKQAGFVPLAVELRRRIQALQTAAEGETDPGRRGELHREIAELAVRLDLEGRR